MNVRVSRRALENTLRTLLEQEGGEEAAAPSAVGTEAPPAEPPAPETKPEPEAPKSKEAKFAEKVKELQRMKSGDVFAAGDRKFKKKAGAFYLAGAQDGMSTEELLSLVRPEFREEVGKKLQKSIREKTGSAGVTIMGDQFIDSTERSATFKYGGTEGGSTVWEDMAGIPVQVIAQYYFQVEQGEEFGSDVAGSIAADVLGDAGAQVLTYRSDELMIVIDPSTSNMYIMSAEYNDYDPLLATKTLLTQIKLNDKVGDDPNDERQGANEYPAIRSGYNTYLKPDGSGEKYAVPLRNFDLGELRKAIGSTRTIFSKFFDLFNTDDIEMNFVFTKWGPAMMRSKVFGSDAFGGGTGAMTSRALDKLKNTGLFREESLLSAGTGTYNVKTDRTQDLAELISGQTTSPVTVTPVSGLSGARVDGLKGVYGVLYTSGDTEDTYDNTYGDAYLLYMNGAMSAEVPKREEEPQPEAKAGVTGTPGAGSPDDDPMQKLCQGSTGVAVGLNMKDKAALFVFNRTDYVTGISGWDADAYSLDVAADVIGFLGDNDAYYSVEGRKIELTVVGTADQRGGDAYNQRLSAERCAKFISDLIVDLNPPTAAKCNFTTVAVGEEFWKGLPDTESEQTRVYKRFVKVYWCKLDQDKANRTIAAYVYPVAAAASRPTGQEGSPAAATKAPPTLTPAKQAALAEAVGEIETLARPGLTLTDGAYSYIPKDDGSVRILRLKDGRSVTWSSKTIDPDRFILFVDNLKRTGDNYVLSYGDFSLGDDKLYIDPEKQNPLTVDGNPVKFNEKALVKADLKGFGVLKNQEGEEVKYYNYKVLAPGWARRNAGAK